ncbi:hypothetical protein ACJX0J_040411, partial [Zea mays]
DSSFLWQFLCFFYNILGHLRTAQINTARMWGLQILQEENGSNLNSNYFGETSKFRKVFLLTLVKNKFFKDVAITKHTQNLRLFNHQLNFLFLQA